MDYDQKIYSKLLQFFIVLIILCGDSCNIPKEFPVSEIVRNKLKDSSQVLKVNGETLLAPSLVRSMYELNHHELIWENYILNDQKFNSLLQLIKNSKWEGLNPEDYHFKQLQNIKKELYPEPKKRRIKRKKKQIILPIPEKKVAIDFLLSDAFLTLAIHYYVGRIQRDSAEAQLTCSFDEMNLPQYILNAAKERKMSKSLMKLLPDFKQYELLKSSYRNLVHLTGKYKDSVELRDKKTLVKINMERWRWMPRKYFERRVIINIPEFTMKLYEGDSLYFNLKTVVGKKENQTPSFHCALKYLVFNPRWNIPSSIVKDEILPQALKDTSYLKRNNILITKSGKDTVQFFDVNWDEVDVEKFPYMLIQSSGRDNPLGMVKFLFPNQYSVYLHDTNAPYLFDREERTYSHGCIRVEKASELAAYFLNDNSLADTSTYKKRFEEDQWFSIDPTYEVFINYWTVWAEEDQSIFLKDIYGRDSSLIAKFQEPIKVFKGTAVKCN